MTPSEILLQLPDGRYLANDFTTWTTDAEEAHRFIPGAALNSCWEEFRRIGARAVKVLDPGLR